MRVVIQTVVYGSETGSLSDKRRKIEVFEMVCLRNRSGVVRNTLRERERERASVRERVERNVLSCLGLWKEYGRKECKSVSENCRTED